MQCLQRLEECMGLQVVVNDLTHVGAGNLTQVLLKSRTHSWLLSHVSTTLPPGFLNKEKCWLKAGYMTNIPSLQDVTVSQRAHALSQNQCCSLSLLRYTVSEPKEPRDQVKEERVESTGQQWRLLQSRLMMLMPQEKVTGSAGQGACCISFPTKQSLDQAFPECWPKKA